MRGDVASLVGQDVYSLLFVTSDKGSGVLHPHVGEEHAASTEHVLNVRQSHGQTPVHVVTRNRVKQVRQKGVAGSCSDKGIVDSGGMGAWRDEGQAQQRCFFEGNRAGDVEIKVDTAILVQNGISQHVGALDVLEVAFVVRSDLGVVFAHEAGRIGVSPQVVLPVGV